MGKPQLARNTAMLPNIASFSLSGAKVASGEISGISNKLNGTSIGDIGWSDIGSWIEFGELHSSDNENNHTYGETLLDGVTNCIIQSENKLIAGLGLKDLIIADTQDGLLIAHKDFAQDVRKIATTLEQRKRAACL